MIASWNEVAVYRGWFPGTDRQLTADEWPAARALFRGETVHDFEIDVETFDTRERKTFLVSAAPVRGEDGALIGAVTVTIDVTSRARRLSDANEALRVRDEVMSIVSHDLRNPLGAIRLSAQRLLRLARGGNESVPTSELLPMVNNIDRSGERMERLLDDLLDVARIEAGRFSIVEGRFTLAPILAEAAELARPHAETKRIAVHVDDAVPASLHIPGDRHRILQVLTNLIGNAIKFTPEGGVVTVSAEERADDVRIFISDTGPGIPPSLQPKIWDRF